MMIVSMLGDCYQVCKVVADGIISQVHNFWRSCLLLHRRLMMTLIRSGVKQIG